MKNKILIVDDSMMNRELLYDILCDDYEILLAENGNQAISMINRNLSSLNLILLDLIMPGMDGFDVLYYMNKYQWIHDIPVVIISSENSGESISRAYDLGASDFINRPFNINIVKKRVSNIISLYLKQRRLKDLVADQIYEKEKRSNMLISILSHIVEFRNGESGAHIIHINLITEKLLKAYIKKEPSASLSVQDISLITMASSLHDIGKISIPDTILNKPGRLTKEEFDIMKTHAPIGAEIINKIELDKNDQLLKYAYEICRWHHERWDGKGYPDGLVQNQIPLSAQVVSLADVYDALTSERCYKKAIEHGKAIQMILNGECGTFNPILLDCLLDIAEDLQNMSLDSKDSLEVQNFSNEFDKYEDLSVTKQMIDQLEIEKIKYHFFFEQNQKMSFIYYDNRNMLIFSPRAVETMDVHTTIINPFEKNNLPDSLAKQFQILVDKGKKSSNNNPSFTYQDESSNDALCFNCQAIWIHLDQPKFVGIMGTMEFLNSEKKINTRR